MAQRERATDWELAQFGRCCRRVRHFPRGLDRTLESLAQSKSANWYVRQQAILTIGWLRLTNEARHLARILFSEWDEEVRRAILPILFLLPTAEENELLHQASRDEAIKVSRMANYLLALREGPTLAIPALKQFTQPNEAFFSDNYWKLYQIRHNPDANTRGKLQAVITRTALDLTGKYNKQHVRSLSAHP